MKHLYSIEKMDHTCLAVGQFEGVHRGHLAVAAKLSAAAKARGLTSVIVSLYDPAALTLTTELEKEHLLKDIGVDILLSLERANVPANLLEVLGAQLIVSGEGLPCERCQAAGIAVLPCPAVRDGDQVIRTALLKEALEASNMERYAALCSHAYLLIGKIIHGKQLGRTVGQPTANQGVPACKIKPPAGVYATISTVEGEVYMGMTNIGKRPSVDNYDYLTIETYLLDFNKDIYGKTEFLEVCVYVRGVMKFDTLEQVKDQVVKDLASVRTKLTEITGSYHGC